MDALTHRLRASSMGDVALAALVGVSVVLATSQIEPSEGERSLDAAAYLSIAVASGVLAVRRRWPLGVSVIVIAALSGYLVRGYVGGPVFVTFYIAVYSLATAGDRRRAYAVAAIGSGWMVAVGLLADTGPGLVHLLFVAWAAAAVFFGDAVRSRRDHLAALEERARHLEQSRDDEARRRVIEERLRIARDLHDSVAHSMATINVQAGTAAHVIESHPERGKEALVVIQQASGEVLDELGALLGLLRLDPGERPERAPAPGLGQLDDLVAATRRAGLQVRLEMKSRPAVVPQSIGVAVYRIVQESLTNVVRHAGEGATATVTVADSEEGGLTVEITDDGRGSHGVTPGAGVGLAGMRERAEATGGSLEAAPGPDGGFTVRASWRLRG